MDNALLNGPTANPVLYGAWKGMSLADAVTKGALAACESGSFSSGGKDYPMFPMGLAVFAADGPDTKLAGIIAKMRAAGILRAWTGGKAQLSNAEIGNKSAAEVSAAPRSGQLLVLKKWDELTEREQAAYNDDPERVSAMYRVSRISPEAAGYSYNSDTYRFEVADPQLALPYVAARRPPTAAEMAATPDSWYADREARLAAEREVTMDPVGARDGATVYSEAGCKGKSRHFFEGRYSMDDLRKSGIGNDAIASVSVGRRYSVTLYAADGFSGTSETFQGGTNAFRSTRHALPAGLFKEVSSMVVTNHRSADSSSQNLITSGSAGSATGYTQLETGRFR